MSKAVHSGVETMRWQSACKCLMTQCYCSVAEKCLPWPSMPNIEAVSSGCCQDGCAWMWHGVVLELTDKKQSQGYTLWGSSSPSLELTTVAASVKQAAGAGGCLHPHVSLLINCKCGGCSGDCKQHSAPQPGADISWYQAVSLLH